MMLFLIPLLLWASDPAATVRNEIVALYQRSLEALGRGDVDTALQMDTEDWVSIVAGQKPRTKQELEPFIRRDIANVKPPPGWNAMWLPDYEHNGTRTGIQVYDLKLEGDSAIVLCLVGGTRNETIDGDGATTLWGRVARAGHVDQNFQWLEATDARKTDYQRTDGGRPSTNQ